MPTLDLPQSSRARVWAKVVEIVTNDPVLSRAVETFVLWDGSKLTQAGDMAGMMPLIRLYPQIGPQDWYSADSHAGPLVIRVFLAIQTRDAADYLNLWAAFEDAFYPAGDRERQLSIERELVVAGAETGLVQFSSPPTNPDARQNESGIYAAEGEIRIDVLRTLAP